MFVVTLPESADPSAFAQKAHDAGADILEVRTDLTPNVAAFKSPLPILLSLRTESTDLLKVLKPTYVDIEGTQKVTLPKGVKCIRSVHHYEDTPDLDALEQEAFDLIGAGADIVKLATKITSYEDLKVLDALHERIPETQQRCILGMGPRAHSNRMLSPLRNALTYTFVEEGEAAAPGQVPLALHLLTKHCKQPKIFGIVGGIGMQSKSPLIHNTLFSHHNIDALYTEFPTDEIEDALHYIQSIGVRGISVTAPHKKTMLQQCDDADELCEQLGATNTVVFDAESARAFNTDVVGIADGYQALENASSVCILGSGGVVPAIIAACKQRSIEDICICARNEQDRQALAERFSVRSSDLHGLASETPDVVFCTISADVALDLPEAKQGATAIDVRYGKSTAFLESARDQGYRTFDGSCMLLHQALAQFMHFTGQKPSTSDLDLLFSLPLRFHGKQ